MTVFGKIIFTALFVVIGIGILYSTSSYVKHDSDVLGVPILDNATTTPQPSLGKKIPFSQLLQQGGSYRCTVAEIGELLSTSTKSGTAYIHDDFVQVILPLVSLEKEIETTVVLRDGYSYIWNSNDKTKGSKRKIVKSSEMIEGATTSQEGLENSWNGDQIGDYSCEEWEADDAVFDIPKSIIFTTE